MSVTETTSAEAHARPKVEPFHLDRNFKRPSFDG
jgi:hypothetical protein